MATADHKTGDLVTHWSAPERVGYVAEVEPDRFSHDDPVYYVVWSGAAEPIAIPYRRYHGLRPFEIPKEA